jgi:tRNA (guanine-N7-)-methyltransferase
MSFRPRPNHPYAHAPRLPEGDAVPVADLLPGAGPIEIEIGPGRGGFLFERAEARPDARLVGLEIRLKWAAIVDDRLKKRGLGARARVINADAREALGRLSPDASVAVFYLHFPDPWWKKRHTKRLVMGDVLLDQIARLLADGGEVFVQTDVEERADLYEAQLAAHPALEPSGDAPGSPRLAENPYGARSPREHHAIADGLPVHRLRFRRRPRTAAIV